MSNTYKSKDKNVKSVTLILTEKCNLNCTYCYEHNKSAASMPLEIAKKIIDEEFAKNDEFDFIEIAFFGGEPLIEFDLIKKIVDYVEQQNFKRDYGYFIITNGTLVHGEVKQWLIDHPNVICGLSLDGNKLMHDMNRSNSFDLIDLKFFAKNYPEQEIKMTISRESLPHLFEGVVFCHEQGFLVACNLACGLDWSDPMYEDILGEQLLKLIEFYIKNPDIIPCTILNREIKYIAYDNVINNTQTRKWCGTGLNIPTYGVDGEKYPCQYFSPLTLGTEKAKEAKKLTFLKDIPDELTDPKCVNCILKAICPTCYGENYAATGNMYIHEEARCRLTKIIIKARAYFKAQQWLNNMLEFDDEDDEQALLRAIKMIQDMD